MDNEGVSRSVAPPPEEPVAVSSEPQTLPDGRIQFLLPIMYNDGEGCSPTRMVEFRETAIVSNL